MKFHFLFLYMVNSEIIMNHIHIPSCRICIFYRPFEFSTKSSPISFELEKTPLDLTITKIGWYKPTIDYVSEPKLCECLKNQNKTGMMNKGNYSFSRGNEQNCEKEEKNNMIKMIKDKIIKFLPHVLLILSIIVSSLLNIYIMIYLVSKGLM